MSSAVQNSFMKSLFFGEIREDIIFPYPRMSSDTSESVRMILDSIEKFSKDHVNSAEWDEKGEMPREIVSYLAELGVLGVAVPEEMGGLGLPQSGYARIMQEFGGIDRLGGRYNGSSSKYWVQSTLVIWNRGAEKAVSSEIGVRSAHCLLLSNRAWKRF